MPSAKVCDMPATSKFSTPDNFAKLSQAKTQLLEAQHEAQLAVSAGIPNAQSALTTAQEALKRVEQVMQVYFPAGAPVPQD